MSRKYKFYDKEGLYFVSFATVYPTWRKSSGGERECARLVPPMMLQIFRLAYLLDMSRKYKIQDQNRLYFVTFTVIQWLDIFIRREYKDIFLDSIRYCQHNKGLEVYAYCIMSSHIHMIIGRNGDEKLEDIIRDIKKFTSVKIVEAIRNNPHESRRELLIWLFERSGQQNSNNSNFQFWQQHNHPIELNTNEMIDQRLNYIHNNPVETGIVLSPEGYLYSSAGNYAGFPEKLIEVILI